MTIPLKNSVFLFQGDSITDGGRGRTDDMNHILGHGYVYLIASELGETYAEQNCRFLNKGVSGDRSVDLYARFEEDALALKPDVVSILVGTNDIGEHFFDFSPRCGIDAKKYKKTYAEILTECRDRLPDSRIILCEPFALPVGLVKENWAKWNQELCQCQQIVKELSEQFGATFVPLQNVFHNAAHRAPASYWIWDGVHPTPWGHRLIAKAWLSSYFAE